VVTLPREAWLETLIAAKAPPLIAGDLVELYEADQAGRLDYRNEERRPCHTDIDDTLGRLVDLATA